MTRNIFTGVKAMRKIVLIVLFVLSPTASFAETCYGWVPACIAVGPASTPEDNAKRCKAAAAACLAACAKGTMAFNGPFGFHPITKCK